MWKKENIRIGAAVRFGIIAAFSSALASLLSPFFISMADAAGCASLHTNCIAWWAAEGTAQDNVGANDGTLAGGATFAPGEVGQAFTLNGTSSTILVPASPVWGFGTNEFTIELWAKFASGAGGQTLVACDEGLEPVSKWIFWLQLGAMQFLFYNPSGSATLSLTPFTPVLNQWYHMALTRRTSQYVFYLNGVPVSTNVDSHSITAPAANLTIGSAEAGNFFKGQLDEIAIYGRALSAGEIGGIYAAGTAGKCPAPPTAPFIVTQPVSQEAGTGMDVTFSVTAGGSRPFQYQWRSNEVSISDATNSAFTIPNVGPPDAAGYSVIVSNSYDSITSSPATLIVDDCRPPSGLIAWWSAEGDAIDRTGAHNGFVDGVGFGAGKVGQAFDFNGTSGVQVPDSDSWAFGTSDFTIELWASFRVQPSGDLNHPAIFVGTTEGSYNFRKWLFGLGGGTLEFLVNAAEGQALIARTAFTPILNHWYHIAITRSGPRYTIFRDGIAIGTETNNLSVPNVNAPLLIGRAELMYFNGLLDEISIYNRALSTNEIAAIYNRKADGKCAPCSRRATATATIQNGSVVGITITDGGCGYTNSPIVWIQGGGGSGAMGTAVVNNGVVVGINIIAGGSNYTNSPDVYIYSPAGLQIALIKAVRPSFTDLIVGTNYQLQVSDDMVSWSNQGSPFTATSPTMAYPAYWDVENWGRLFFRVMAVP